MKTLHLTIVVIISVLAVGVPVGIFTALNENPILPINIKEQLTQLALSDPRVKESLDGQPYHIVIGNGFNLPPLYDDMTITFIFDNGSYVLVSENNFQHRVINVIVSHGKYAIA